MAATVVNTLYPPQVDTFLPAFVNTESVKFYFSLSPLNGKSEIKRVQIIITDQKTNENCLKNVSGVLFYEFSGNTIQQDKDTGRYYVMISPSELKSEKWDINKFYKIQIRFDNCHTSPIGMTQVEQISYLNENTINFSEWSTVCLIKAILQPSIRLKGFNEYDLKTDPPSYNRGQMTVAGRLIFGDNSSVETETMSSYYIDVVPTGKTTPVLTTDTIYTSANLNPNEINYTLNLGDISESEGDNFSIIVHYKTKNEYEGYSVEYPFTISGYSQGDWNPTCKFYIDNEEGQVKLHVDNASVLGHIYIYRSSSVYNFKKWETVAAYRVHEKVDIDFTDITVGSHIWYQYRVQFKSRAGVLSDVKNFSDGNAEDENTAGELVFPQFYDAFISRMDKQLDVRYDFKVSNYKPITNRVKIDTLGSKYPRFAENAILGYKQFSLSGTLSSEADVNQLFLKKTSHFDNMYTEYQNYLSDNNIKKQWRNDFLPNSNGEYKETTQYDYLWDREFREEVIGWLNDGEPKLFRSMTEGLIPVMITDVSFTPNDTLGRRIWSFTATAYQVGEGHSLKELDSLGIINIPGYGDDDVDNPDIPEIDYAENLIPFQMYDWWPTTIHTSDNKTTDDLLLGELDTKIRERYVGLKANMTPQLFPGEDYYIKNLKISFLNLPHVFELNADGEPLEFPDKTQPKSNNNNTYYGYRFGINANNSDNLDNDTILIGSSTYANRVANNYYQTPSDLEITSLTFPDSNTPGMFDNDHVLVEGLVYYRERATEGSEITKTSVVKMVVAQEQGMFEPNEYLGSKIRKKHTYIQKSATEDSEIIEYYQRMDYFKGINFECTPYAVASIRYYGQNEYTTVVIGATGMLNMMSDYNVQDLCFLGRRMKKADSSRAGFLREFEFILDKSAPNPGTDATKKTWHLVNETDTKQKVFVDADNQTIDMFTNEWQVTSSGELAVKQSDGIVRPLTEDEMKNYIVYNSFDEIAAPQINHIYLVGTMYYIYYIDGCWYPVRNWSEDGRICVPEIPIQGQINYKGQVIRAFYR